MSSAHILCQLALVDDAVEPLDVLIAESAGGSIPNLRLSSKSESDAAVRDGSASALLIWSSIDVVASAICP